jgi:hypothetical protein
MALVASNETTGGGFEKSLLEESNYMARVVQVIDMGIQPQRAFQGQEKPPVQQIRVTYELVTEFLEGDETKPRWISEQFPLYSLGSDRAKSTKRYLMLDPTREHKGDWSKLVGSPCLVHVTKWVSKDGSKEGNGVGSVGKPLSGMPVPELVNEGSFFDYDAPNMDMFTAFPDWLKELLTEAGNYPGSALQQALGGDAPAPVDEDAPFDEDIPV